MKIDVGFASEYIRFAPDEKQQFYNSLNEEEKVRFAFAVKNLYDELLNSAEIVPAGLDKLRIIFGVTVNGQVLDFTDDL